MSALLTFTGDDNEHSLRDTVENFAVYFINHISLKYPIEYKNPNLGYSFRLYLF